MDSKFKIFLDLEETVIDSWQSGMLIRSSQVRDFLKEQNATNVTIFSFAVWDSNDQQVFDKQHRRALQKSLDTGIVLVPTVQDFMAADTKLTGVNWHGDVTEFICLRGKVGAFINWCKLHHPTTNCLLVDDIVPNMDIIDHDTNTTIKFINVNKLS